MTRELRTILPIFLLYTITTGIFITVFSLFYYADAKEELYSSTIRDLKVHARIAQRLFVTDASPQQIVNAIERHDVNIFDIQNSRYIYQTFEAPRFGAGIYNSPDHTYFSYITHARGHRPPFLIEFRSTVPTAQVNVLLTKTIILASVAGIFALIVSFFIIRLSYRPLLRQIKLQNDFITDTTHEINTPLSVIVMSLEMFESNPPKYLANIKSAAFTLSNLFSDLSINFKHEQNRPENINLTALLDERIAAFSLPAAAKSITIDFAGDSDIFIVTDRFKITKIIDNLLSNAVKYSDRSTTINVTLNSDSAKPLNLKVANTGPLIAPKNLAKIYEKFSRFDSQNGGFGIGLSLVKRYINELGFNISCESVLMDEAAAAKLAASKSTPSKSAAITTFAVTF